MPVMFRRRVRGWRFVLLNVALGLGHLAVLFNASSYVALLPHAAGDLGGVKPSFGTWAQTDFMIALVFGFPLAHWLSNRIGDYRLFGLAFVVYAAASYGCAASRTLWLFLPARVLLGVTGGLTLSIGQALWMDEYPDRRKSLGLALWGLVTLLPFTLGLPLGGWIADEWGWRALFYLNIPVALAVAGITGALLYGRGFARRRVRFDCVGFVLLALVLGGFQTLLNMGNDFDWLEAPFLRGVLVVAVIALIVLVVWEQGVRHPVVDLRLLAHRNFAIGALCWGGGWLAIQGLLALLTVQLQVLMGYSSYLAGLVFVPLLLLGAPAVVLMHALCNRVDARLLACLNCLGFAAVLYWIGLYDDLHSYDQIFWPLLVGGLFLGSFFAPLSAITLHGLSGRLVQRAAETAAMLRLAAGALGIAFQGMVQFRRAPVHQLHMADRFGGRQFVSFDALHPLSDRLMEAGLTPDMVNATLKALITQQAGVLALSDTFLLAGYLFLGLAALVWMAAPPLRPVQAPLTRARPAGVARKLGEELQ